MSVHCCTESWVSSTGGEASQVDENVSGNIGVDSCIYEMSGLSSYVRFECWINFLVFSDISSV